MVVREINGFVLPTATRTRIARIKSWRRSKRRKEKAKMKASRGMGLVEMVGIRALRLESKPRWGWVIVLNEHKVLALVWLCYLLLIIST